MVLPPGVPFPLSEDMNTRTYKSYGHINIVQRTNLRLNLGEAMHMKQFNWGMRRTQQELTVCLSMLSLP